MSAPLLFWRVLLPAENPAETLGPAAAGTLGIVPVRAQPAQIALAALVAGALALAAAALLIAFRRPLQQSWRTFRGRGRLAPALAASTGLALAGLALAALLQDRAAPAPVAGSRRPVTAPASQLGSWPTLLGGPQRLGHPGGEIGPASGNVLWTFRDPQAPAPFAGSPALAGDRLYVGSDNRHLYCLQADRGTVLWQFRAQFELFGSPALARGRLYFGEGLHEARKARLYCVDALSGELQWTFQTQSHIEFGPTLFEDRVYFGAGDDGLYCLDATSGHLLWQFGEAHVDLSPAVSDRGVFFGSVYGAPHCYALDPQTGRVRWEQPAPLGVCGSPSLAGNRVLFGLGNGTFGMSHAQPQGAVWCLATEDGQQQWSCDVPDSVLTSVAVQGDTGFFGSRDGRLYAVDLQSGQIRWSFAAQAPVLSSPAADPQRVYFGAENGRFYCLDVQSGQELWQYEASRVSFAPDARILAAPALRGQRVFFGALNGVFFCLGEKEPLTAAPGTSVPPGPPPPTTALPAAEVTKGEP